MIKSPIAKIAAAALILLVVVFGIIALDRSSTPAYGMTDALEFISQAKTLHIQGWNIPRYDTPPKKVKLPFERWYDLENGRYRIDYSLRIGDGNEIDHLSRICDGQYIMSENRYKTTGDQWHKTIHFQRVNPAEGTNLNWLDWYRQHRQIEGFYRIGQEVIGGERFDIWEGEYNSGVGENVYRVRLQTWLSPSTAQVGRSKTWHQIDGEWTQVGESTIFERNVSLPENIFQTEPPAGYEIMTAKEDATIRVRQERDIYEGTQFFRYAPLNYWVAPVFHLNDGSLLACWQSVDAKESLDQSGYFQGLRIGGELPKLPTEIFALSPEPNVRNVQFIGYHLAFTLKDSEKGKRWYEWSLYIPDKDPPPVNAVLIYRVHRRLNVKRAKDIENLINQTAVDDPQEIKTEEDFNTLVLGAMGERSDGGLVPEYVNYENVLQVAERLRESLAQRSERQR